MFILVYYSFGNVYQHLKNTSIPALFSVSYLLYLKSWCASRDVCISLFISPRFNMLRYINFSYHRHHTSFCSYGFVWTLMFGPGVLLQWSCIYVMSFELKTLLQGMVVISIGIQISSHFQVVECFPCHSHVFVKHMPASKKGVVES